MKIYERVKDNRFVIVSFFTSGFYEGIMNEYLLPSVQKYDLSYYIEEISDEGNWGSNTNCKPLFIQRMLEKFKDTPIIWLDADSKICKNPGLFDRIPEEFDMGCHYLDVDRWYNRVTDGRKELLSGLLFFRRNNRVIAVVSNWARRVQVQPLIWEQKHLAEAVAKISVNIFKFPLEYSYIYSLPNGNVPFIKIADPVIIQYQASRQVKKEEKARNYKAQFYRRIRR